MTVPPVNSTDRCSPLENRKNTAARNVTSEITLKTSAFSMNGMSRRILKNSTACPFWGRTRHPEHSRLLGLGYSAIGAGPPDCSYRYRLQFLLPAVPEVHQAAGKEDRREHRGEDADA